jgi:arylsulfatase A-like enzyme
MNLIVIVSDTFRYDYLGANGNSWIKTPELDAFSRIAVNFDRCTISSFPTIPTRTDWFTGRYGFPFHGWQPLDPKTTAPVDRSAGPGGSTSRHGTTERPTGGSFLGVGPHPDSFALT